MQRDRTPRGTQVDLSLRRLGSLGIALMLTGCGSTLEPEIPDISGAWTFTEEWSNSGLGIACDNAGSLVIEQDGASFSGSFVQEGTCTRRAGDTFEDSASGAIRVGQVAGQVAGFSAANCNYRATISGEPPDQLSGTVWCTLSAGTGGTIVRFNGTWLATM